MSRLNDAILNNLITAVIVLDHDFIVKYANPAAEQLLCSSARRLYGFSFSELIVHSSIDLSYIKSTLKKGPGLTQSDVSLLINGQLRQIEFSASTIKWNAESNILFEIKPISQQQKISAEFQQNAQQNAAKDLVRNLAHEIKNPLGGLRGAAQLLEKCLPNKNLHEYTQIIIEQADRLKNLVDRLLGPQKPTHRQEENIHLVLEKARRLMELEAPHIQIVRDYDPSLPDFNIDSEQLEQAILNVLNNAVQALENTPKAKIIMRTRTDHQVLIKGQTHRLAARIEICDNGPGISFELQETLFYPMVTGRVGGSGLGLSITRNLIEQHSGNINVQSEPGKTNFTVLLPINR